ncbi:NADPH:quinone reductase-like Zn-dependent oxidoreductase [Pseudonocardia sediminis]|uniref:NADPH:quinone reductase-like Zn-dependent oxidoreductase n=1 Tax=Pseudonocardia sediminis TaxID=1397368 RepID=A0A4Q7V2D6_PSEST|nr:NADP-dependent oxidoreductase [Pseudonocardia sediminis]RZT86739.1 NADPH:quinone reductase-like Zn-dependent oxidoreductase [Pseudonocardia sediminis]
MAAAIVATAFGGPEVLSLVDVEVPVPGPGEATVAVRAAAINPVDHKIFSGAFGADGSSLPLRVGLEGAGVVTAVGEGASVAVGDEVIVAGPGAGGLYASEVTVADTALTAKPAELGWEEAAGLLLVGGTAEHTLVATGVGEGDVVLVHGVAGSVGLVAAQLAIHRGARVIGTAAPARHDALRGYGIEPVAYGEGLADRVRAAAPDGISAAIDTVGTDEAVDVSLDLVADRDRIATIAAFGRAAEAGIKALGGGPGADPGTEIRAAARPELARLAAEGTLTVVVARTYPLAEAADAVRFVQEGHAGGKVVLLP